MKSSMIKIPERLDIVVCNFSPVSGNEQAGNRPALVISGKQYNEESGFIIVCPITSRERGNYFEVKFKTSKTSGVILAHQIRTMDYRSRKIKVVDKIGDEKYREVVEKLKIIIEG